MSNVMNLRSIGRNAAVIGGTVLLASPALAHHAMGGGTPTNAIQGFLSGLAHPLIGPDHFAAIVAIGLLAALKRQGAAIPVAFVLSAMVGTGLHLAKLSIPGVELWVSASILMLGALISLKNSPNTAIVAGLAGLAGLFHGYAYGEAIFGAQATPLVAYLVGFTAIQAAVSLGAFWLGKQVLLSREFGVRSAGLLISGMGLAFFASQVMAVVFPLPKM
ncbi:MAG: HupE/UreJ family protein [Alkalinema sp. RU_4_3]|nr:HupE/UreJ family protein [Alkalinema sp. RU_4_3]